MLDKYKQKDKPRLWWTKLFFHQDSKGGPLSAEDDIDFPVQSC